MRTVLTALFDEVESNLIADALRSDEARSKLRTDLNQTALADGKLGAIPLDQYGDNLLHGLLALRSKFDRETALAKLEVNLSMRAGRGA